jgi:YD repeat-containing protein
VVRHRTETVYNAEGQVEAERRNVRHIVLADGTVQINRAAAQTTTFAYDERGNRTKTIFPDGSLITAEYDKLNRKRSETNQLGLTRTFEYDDADRLTAVELPGVVNPATGQVVRPRYEYRYDPQGNQTLLRDPLLRETRFTVTETATGQERTRTLPLGYGADGIRGTADDPPAGAWTERTVYDNRGRQTLHVSFAGVVTEFRYHPQTQYFQV